MTIDPLRTLRSKADQRFAASRQGLSHRGTPRFTGQVVSGGNMPHTVDRVYLVRPIQVDGDESEGAAAAITVDPLRTVPVAFVGDVPPTLGQYVHPQAVGGRWVAEA